MTAATAQDKIHQPETDESKVALPLRSDTFFGVCEAIGREFGFNPNWLRLAFGVLILFSPLAALAGYVGLGLFVGASFLLFPNRSSATTRVEAASEATGEINEAEERMAA